MSRLRLAVALCVVTPLGFATGHYAGPADRWVRDHGGGILYVVFWILVVLFLAPRARPALVAFWVFLATCLVEVAQLWHPPLLESARATYLGRTLLGTTFKASDFPYYALGAVAGYLLARASCRSRAKPAESGRQA